jgi:hypothetical protein
MRYRLRTLMIAMALGPPALAWFWFAVPVVALAAAYSVLAAIIVAPISLAGDYAASMIWSICTNE